METNMKTKALAIWKHFKAEPAFALLCNLGLMLVIYYLCRIAFFLVNKSYFSEMTFGHFLTLLQGGFKFDASAIAYTNMLYMLMQVLPFKFRLNAVYQTVAKWIFIITNSIAVIANCADMVYFPFVGRRTTSTVFSEFQHEDNLGKVFMHAAGDSWYVVLFAIIIIFAIYRLYYKPSETFSFKSKFVYYPLHTALLCLVAYGAFISARGGIVQPQRSRPITLNQANKYVNKSTETAIVLNTPFCIIRTAGKVEYANPKYFEDETAMAAIFSPIHHPQPTGEFKPLNVVVIIVESLCKEYSGFLNKDLDNGTYKGYTPFLDSLYAEGLTFEHSFANGRQSVDAMPSVLSSIPKFIESYVLSPYATNNISSIADVLKTKGYYSAFFHGAPNSSMGFSAYARSAGFDDYFGQDEYGDRDLDGTWAVWDEEFLQYYADKMGELPQPFVTSLFTATSHHPFKIPARYEGKFPKGTQDIHQTIGYLDYAISRFFKKMAQYDWFENTLFVITADHTNQATHEEYFTDANLYAVPILFYHPGSNLKGMEKMPVQQMDIMPSILSYMNYDKPYFAFGQDIFSTPAEDKFVANYNTGRYQYIKNEYFLQFDGQQTNAVYNYQSDVLLRNNLKGQVPEQEEMETRLKAVIQQYVVRMTENKLTL
ncbi:sulfatase [Bacteroidia bacterium]|nr:sulfatase [Bacteroidia bacterium]